MASVRMPQLLLLLIGTSAHALRVRPSLSASSRDAVSSRRDVLAGAAAAAAMLQAAPAHATAAGDAALADLLKPGGKPTTLLGVIREIELTTPKESRNVVTPTTHTPVLTSEAQGPVLTNVEFSVNVWVSEVGPARGCRARSALVLTPP